MLKYLRVKIRKYDLIIAKGTFTVSNLSSFRTSSLFFVSFLCRCSITGLSFIFSFNNWLSIICLLLLLLFHLLKSLWVIVILLLLLWLWLNRVHLYFLRIILLGLQF